MKEERLICPTAPKLSTVTERCLKTKLHIYTSPRNGTYLFCAQFHSPTLIVSEVSFPNLSPITSFHLT
jgi:hypothetical protein